MDAVFFVREGQTLLRLNFVEIFAFLAILDGDIRQQAEERF